MAEPSVLWKCTAGCASTVCMCGAHSQWKYTSPVWLDQACCWNALQVVPAQYAFVVHTANPISKQKGETFGEVVMGMGEALVGNYPGRALSFSAAPGQQVCCHVTSAQYVNLPLANRYSAT